MCQCTDWGEIIHCSLDFNFLLTEHEGCTGEKKPKVLATQTKCSIVHTKMSESKYFPVWLKKVMSDASRYFITWYFYQTILFNFNLPAFENKNTQLIILPWKWSVWQNMNQVRTNQVAQIYLRTTFQYNKKGYHIMNTQAYNYLICLIHISFHWNQLFNNVNVTLLCCEFQWSILILKTSETKHLITFYILTSESIFSLPFVSHFILVSTNEENLFNHPEFYHWGSFISFSWSATLWDERIINLNYYQYMRPNRKLASSKHTLSGPQNTDSGLLMHYQPYSWLVLASLSDGSF